MGLASNCHCHPRTNAVKRTANHPKIKQMLHGRYRFRLYSAVPADGTRAERLDEI